MTHYAALENFLAAYFHQDWAMEHATPDAVVDYYRGAESAEQIAATRDDIERLLAAATDEAALASAARAAGCEYDPTREGGTWRSWFESVASHLGAF